MKFSTNEDTAIREIESLNEDELFSQIKKISLAAWDNSIELISVKSWLNNFTGEYLGSIKAEKNLALWLVLNFVFYTDRDVRALTSNLWWKYIHYQLNDYTAQGFMSDKSLEERYNYIVSNTCIQPLGNCSGSGTNICYFFRQSNNLGKESFEMKPNDEFKYLVLVDDVTVSGTQATENLEIYKEIDDSKKYILTFISSNKARERIGDTIHVISSIEIDERSKCFDENSYVFSLHKNWISIARKMCKYYGEKINQHNPLGYRNGQYLFGFYYNTPNNVLPIFWGTNNNWHPLFKRYFSDYNEMEIKNSEKFL